MEILADLDRSILKRFVSTSTIFKDRIKAPYCRKEYSPVFQVGILQNVVEALQSVLLNRPEWIYTRVTKNSQHSMGVDVGLDIVDFSL